MANDVFSRYENKYTLDGRTFRKVQAAIADNMEADKFNRGGEMYTIRNIYYDTQDNSLIRQSLAKPLYKEKIRLRAYGEVYGESDVFVEIKKKFNGLVSKRRSKLKLCEAYEFLDGDFLPESRENMNFQVLREARYIIERERPKPALYLAYDRFAYFGVGRHDLRISFDTNIRTRRENVQFEYGDFGENLLKADTWIMEIKVASSIPIWLCKLLSEFEIYPVSYSKYGAEYTKTLANKLNGGEKECSILYFPQRIQLQSA
jgi:hypothetical protein